MGQHIRTFKIENDKNKKSFWWNTVSDALIHLTFYFIGKQLTVLWNVNARFKQAAFASEIYKLSSHALSVSVLPQMMRPAKIHEVMQARWTGPALTNLLL